MSILVYSWVKKYLYNVHLFSLYAYAFLINGLINGLGNTFNKQIRLELSVVDPSNKRDDLGLRLYNPFTVRYNTNMTRYDLFSSSIYT